MKTFRIKFPRRVRIHGGDCGAVARALHHRAQKEALDRVEQTLISDECVFLSQAGLGKASNSTSQERKIMSLKTYFKKVAVIAAAALTLGGLSALPASAAVAAVSTTFSATPTVASGSPVVVPIQVAGNNSDSQSFSFTGGTEVTWSAVATSNPGVTISPSSGVGSQTFTVTKNNGTDETFDLTVTITGASGTSRILRYGDGTLLNPVTAFVTFTVGTPTASALTLANTAAVNTTAPLSSYPVNSTVTIEGIQWTNSATITAGTTIAAPATTSVTASLTTTNGAISSSGFSVAAVATVAGSPAKVSATSATGIGTQTLSSTVTALQTAAAVDSVSYTGAKYSFFPTKAGVYTLTLTTSPTSTIVRTITVANSAVWRLNSANTTVSSTSSATTDSSQNLLIKGTATAAGQVVALDRGNSGALPSLASNQSYYYVSLSGGTFANLANGDNGVLADDNGFPNGSLNLGTTLGTATAISWTVLNDSTTQVWVNAPVAGGTVTAKFGVFQKDVVSGFTQDITLQTITISIAAPGTLNAAKSEAVICSTGTTGTYPMVGCNLATTVEADEDSVLARAELAGVGGIVSAAGTAKAVIRVTLKDVAGINLIGTLPAVGASIDGPGTMSIGTSPNADASTGRYLTLTKAPASTFYINVFSDGNNGEATINILVAGGVWKSKTIQFYGTPTKLTASTALKVLKAGTTYAIPSTGCALVGTCNTLLELSPAVQVVATDNKNIPVPGLTYTGTQDGTVILDSDVASNSGDAIADSIGATWFSVITSPSAKSGDKGTVSYTAKDWNGTVVGPSNTLTFAIGGATKTVTMSLASGASTDVGAASSLVFASKDADGNAPYDANLTLALTSNVAIVVGNATTATNALPIKIFMIGGEGKVKFYNPLVPGKVTISGTAGGVAVTTTVDVKNAAADAQSAAAISAIEAAADAAAEAIDAANAATDAANLAAEAADAATVAAEEARDAADAATAAIEELATQVASLIAALQAQIKTLANTVAKIAKKVKA